MDKKLYKLKIINDKDMIVSMHTYHDNSNGRYWVNKRLPNKPNELKTKSNYWKTIRKNEEKIREHILDMKNCKFITLTFKYDLTYNECVRHLTNYLNTIKRNFDRNIKYMRAIEVQEESKRFHIHLILSSPVIRKITNKWLREHWKHGWSWIEKIYDTNGVIEYMTLYKKNNIKDEYAGLTYFPKNAKIISGNLKELNSIRYTEVDKEHLNFILDYHNRNNDKVKYNGHFYNDNNGTPQYCLDKIYIESSKEFVENNFGTIEDDIKTK